MKIKRRVGNDDDDVEYGSFSKRERYIISFETTTTLKCYCLYKGWYKNLPLFFSSSCCSSSLSMILFSFSFEFLLENVKKKEQ